MSHACRNKEIRREYLEIFVMQEISRMIFDELDAEKIVAEYYKYHTTFDEESTNKLKQLNGALQSINKKIDNIISAVANTGSSALLSSLQDYEAEREKIKRQLEEVEKQAKTQTVTETMVELAYEYARGLYRSGDKNLYRQLIHLYVDKIIVYYDHVEFYLNTLPADILKGELDRSLGIGEEESLVEYMMRCDPSIVEALKTLESNQKKMGTVDDGTHEAYKRKKAENPLKINELSTFIGGGDGS